jgi:hypothetical protein
VIGREGPGPERPGPDYPPEWDREPEEPEEVCGTCGAPVTWEPGAPPGRPDLAGSWLDELGLAGVRGSSGHRHQP